jgi:hypothetical protein
LKQASRSRVATRSERDDQEERTVAVLLLGEGGSIDRGLAVENASTGGAADRVPARPQLSIIAPMSRGKLELLDRLVTHAATGVVVVRRAVAAGLVLAAVACPPVGAATLDERL